ncbi:TonB-dependent receptor [Novosphingobium sediminicola]|uniref:Iron complex outermembrane receptor protein n=1 Tax=Novosphingobium sediminicola TaxID=563162 RepID=A0A7W6CJ91_9SPHN|nr:TonB-dependent receptor [Novosphingobium sediminicola]MBB3954081.1 iron complex outermembrane receptor protein [Novosphingobium sediminicola]
MGKIFKVIMASTALVACSPALAQTAPGKQAKSDDKGVPDIVVTANRVESSAQKTPVALTVYRGAELTAAGVTSVANLSRVDPSVNFTARNGAGYIAVRGIASTDVTEIGDPSVPIARDGFFTNRSFSINTSMYDLQRVEVLKGPQGTLFGRNSTGGLVSLITARPGKQLGGFVTIEAGNYRQMNVDAAVDLPLSDKVQLRLAGISHRHDGYRELLSIGGRGDDDATLSGRATLAFQPFENFEGLIQYQHDDIDNVGDVAFNTTIAAVPTNYDPKRFASYAPTSNRLTGDRIRWEFALHGLPLDATLSYAGGYDKQKWAHKLDGSGSASAPATFIQSEQPATWNHEVRIATPQDRMVSAQVGYFHFDETSPLSAGFQNLSGAYSGQYLVHFNYLTKTQSDAVFGQFGFKPAETIRLTAGARYTWDKKQRTGDSQLRCDIAGIPPFLYGIIGCSGTPPVHPATDAGNIAQSKPTWLLGVDWTPTNRNMVYAKFSTGYKSGGFNSNGSAPPVPYGAENITSWELGTKNRLLDGQLLLNGDVFYQTYRGYQASQATPAVSSGSGVFNVGNATIYGAEAQAVFNAGDLRFELNGTYLHTEFGAGTQPILTTDPATGNGISRNVVGHRLPNAPGLAVSASLEYRFDMGKSGSLTPRIDGKYSSNYYFDVFNDVDTAQKSYATGNLSLTYQPENSKLQIAVFIRNFTDKTVYASAQRNFTPTPFVNAYQFQAPRTFGARVNYSF